MHQIERQKAARADHSKRVKLNFDFLQIKTLSLQISSGQQTSRLTTLLEPNDVIGDRPIIPLCRMSSRYKQRTAGHLANKFVTPGNQWVVPDHSKLWAPNVPQIYSSSKIWSQKEKGMRASHSAHVEREKHLTLEMSEQTSGLHILPAEHTVCRYSHNERNINQQLPEERKKTKLATPRS